MNEDDLDKLFAQRQEIDRALLERHAKEIAVLFTDVVGSTRFFEERGDIEGLQLIRRHNELLLPLVAQNRGRVIKTIGDSIMAAFEDGADALRCAAQMQRALQEANTEQTEHPLRVRIGVHAGKAFLTGDDVFGDTVNTAARITREAGPGEVLSSASLFDKHGGAAGLSATRRAPLTLKGKAEPLPVALVHWGEAAPDAGAASARELVLEVRLKGSELELCAALEGEGSDAVRTFAASSLSTATLAEATSGFEPFMHEGGAAAYLSSVRQKGEALFARLLPDDVRAKLAAREAEYLRLQIDAPLASVPWELLHDGTDFLGIRYALGRRVSARAESPPPPQSTTGRALVVGNPSGGLPSAEAEGTAVAELLRGGWSGTVEHLHGPLTQARFLEALKGCELLHFAGHTEPSALDAREPRRGFVLSDGWVSAEQVAQAMGGAAPALVFANSCRTASGRGFLQAGQAAADLASTLLLRGTRHCVGPIWDISDEDALSFALRFYEQALQGASIGHAVRKARALLASAGRQPLSFAAYVLYGEPRLPLPRSVRPKAAPPRMRSTRTMDDVPVVQLPGTRRAPARRTLPRVARLVLPALGLAAVAGGALAWRLRGAGSGTDGSTAAGPTSTGAAAARPPVPRAPRHGPIRVCVLPFKNLTEDPALDLRQALAELVTSDLASAKGIRIIERPQVDTQIHWIEFEQSKYVDPKTRTELGKLLGAEVAVLGGYQRLGQSIRIYARFVDVETGEVLHGLKVDGPADADKLFELQDKLGEQVRATGGALEAKLRQGE